MKIETASPAAGITVVRPEGEVDMNTSPEFRAAVEQAVKDSDKGVIIDLAALEYMDSSGVAVLIEGVRWSKTANVKIILAQPSEAVREVIELARLQKFFAIEASIDSAVGSLQ